MLLKRLVIKLLKTKIGKNLHQQLTLKMIQIKKYLEVTLRLGVPVQIILPIQAHKKEKSVQGRQAIMEEECKKKTAICMHLIT